MNITELRQRQSLPMEQKLILTKRSIQQFYDHYDGKVYVSVSGGKDSLCLAHIVHEECGLKDVPLIHVATGLEFPEVEEKAREIATVILRPKMPFNQVIKTFGVPLGSKKIARYVSDLQNPTPENEATRNLRLTGYNRKGVYCPSMKLPAKWLHLVEAPFKVSDKCCLVMKEEPLQKYAKETGRHPIMGVMAAESQRREKEYLAQGGCNAFDNKNPKSTPLAFWTPSDVLEYLSSRAIKLPSVYGNYVINEDGTYSTTGEARTGCVFCGFGCHLQGYPNRFQRLEQTHPKLHRYCMEELGMAEALQYIGVDPYNDPLRKWRAV